jgi:hypothetical protein
LPPSIESRRRRVKRIIGNIIMLNNPIEIDGIKCRRREKEVLKSANVAHLNINNHSPISSSD